MNKEQMLSRMNPELRASYQAMLPYSLEYSNLVALRKNSLEFCRENLSDAIRRSEIRFQTRVIAGGPGNDALTLRIYEPAGRTGRMPILLYLHGGGGIMNSAEECDFICVDLALRENCVVVSPEYRLAPEFPAPAGQLDCLAAWDWLCGDGRELLDIDLARSAFHGGSGGGNMVLGAALRLLDAGKRQPALYQPLYPMIDDRGTSYSSYEIQDTSLWGREQNMQAWDYYINGLSGARSPEVSPYTAPARRTDFTGLAPVFTFVGELDQFRDETVELVKNLSRSGVSTEFTLYPGCYHGFELYAPDAGISKQAQSTVHAALQRVFYPAPQAGDGQEAAV